MFIGPHKGAYGQTFIFLDKIINFSIFFFDGLKERLSETFFKYSA